MKHRTKQCTFACLAAAGVIGLCRGAENGVAATTNAASSRPVTGALQIGDASTNSTATNGFIWPSAIPAGCPFPGSPTLTGVFFTGRHSDYHCGDTWYPIKIGAPKFVDFGKNMEHSPDGKA